MGSEREDEKGLYLVIYDVFVGGCRGNNTMAEVVKGERSKRKGLVKSWGSLRLVCGVCKSLVNK